MSGRLDEGPGLLALLTVGEVALDDRADRRRLGGTRIAAASGKPEESACFASRRVGGPGCAMRANSNESLPTGVTILENVSRIAPLPPAPKTPDAVVSNGLARPERGDCADSDHGGPALSDAEVSYHSSYHNGEYWRQPLTDTATLGH
jgi:hypothetical protein